MKKARDLLLLLLLILLFVGCQGTKDVKEIETSEIVLTEFTRSTPEEQGMDLATLELSEQEIQKIYPNNFYSLMVVRHGSIVYEKYYNGMTETDANPVYSITKSFMSALTGIAIDQKIIGSTEDKISQYIPDYFANVDDERKSDITIQDVLTMRGGLATVDDDYGSYAWSHDWTTYALSKPMTDDPGEKFVYNTGLVHFLSGVITKASNLSTLEFAQKNLFDPLGIEIEKWERDPQWNYGGGTGLYLKPIDMAKFGYLYLHNGEYFGKTVLPKEWVEDSVKEQLMINQVKGYGYLFWNWNTRAKVGDQSFYAFSACGAGGQYIMVVPELDLVVVVTANANSKSINGADTINIIWDYVLPAIKEI